MLQSINHGSNVLGSNSLEKHMAQIILGSNHSIMAQIILGSRISRYNLSIMAQIILSSTYLKSLTCGSCVLPCRWMQTSSTSRLPLPFLFPRFHLPLPSIFCLSYILQFSMFPSMCWSSCCLLM